ncbi:MAG: Hsp20/alpha crystallin family protein [Meiothermus sp.]|nr:Hsp20/alpha crystallin family protein [Meiothermus sp.]
MLSRFDPFREMGKLRREIERVFDQSPLRFDLEFADVGTMPLDVYEEGDKVMVKASLPGLKPEEIKVEVRGDVLYISGEAKQTEEKKERDYHLREHRFTRFERSIVLPSEVVSEKAQANFEDGVLFLTLPKTETTKPKAIPVRTKVGV